MEDKATTVYTLPPAPPRAREKVMVLVPFGGFFDPRFYISSFVASVVAEKSGLDVNGVNCTWRQVIQGARNTLAKEFLESDCEWSMWFDSDMTFPPDVIIKLWRWAKRMNAKWVTGCYYQRFAPHKSLLFRHPPNHPGSEHEHKFHHEHVSYATGRQTPFAIDCAGFGCMLIHRDVFKDLPKPYFKFTSDPDNPEKESSEDFWFCANARAAGFQLYAIPEVECGHIPEAEPVTRADYEKLRKTENMIEILEEYKEIPNGIAK